jgi:hypothetical protein
MTTPTKVNYLNNKDIMEEIHKSKTSYSSFTLPEYHRYDLILNDISEINIRTVAAAKRAKAKRLTLDEFQSKKIDLASKVKLDDCKFDYKKLGKQDVIFRIMTYDHIPLNLNRKKNHKTEADRHDKINFPPFQHWKYDEEGNLSCVGKSHWKGDINTGVFCQTHGKTTDKLALMYMKLCERYSTRSNVRGYSYVDEMKCHAILQLVLNGLKFDESKSSNPFAYLTSSLINAQLRVLKIEKNNQLIRDELLEMNGLNPSNTRLHNHEFDQRSAQGDDWFKN